MVCSIIDIRFHSSCLLTAIYDFFSFYRIELCFFALLGLVMYKSKINNYSWFHYGRLKYVNSVVTHCTIILEKANQYISKINTFSGSTFIYV